MGWREIVEDILGALALMALVWMGFLAGWVWG